jgi:hypothetical protein
VATQNLALGRPILESHWKDDVIFNDDEENKIERKRK